MAKITKIQKLALEHLAKDAQGDLRAAARAALRARGTGGVHGFAVSRVENRLRVSGLVQQIPDPKKERYVHALTPAGLAAIGATTQVPRELEKAAALRLPFLQPMLEKGRVWPEKAIYSPLPPPPHSIIAATHRNADGSVDLLAMMGTRSQYIPAPKIAVGDIIVHIGRPEGGDPRTGARFEHDPRRGGQLVGGNRYLALARFYAGVEAPFTFWHAPTGVEARRLSLVDKEQIDWAAAGVVRAERPAAPALSYGVELQTQGSTEWTGNEIRFATKEEATEFAAFKHATWLIVMDTRVVERHLEPNYAWCTQVEGNLVPIKEE